MNELSEPIAENQNESLLTDSIVREQLSEAARWAKFLAIMGFIGCGLIVIIGICLSLFFSYLNSSISSRYTYSEGAFRSGRTSFIWIFYIIGSVLYFFRCLFLYRFAVKMKSGLHERNEEEMTESFRNLKRLFKYNGILTIVVISIYVIFLFAGMILVLNR